MIDHIQGKVFSLSPEIAVLSNSGVGYRINITESTHDEIKQSETALLYVHEEIKETERNLFGFTEPSERSLFKLLISAKGIGCAAALRISNSLSYELIVNSIRTGDSIVFETVRGIGRRSAESIIQSLNGKI